MVELRGRLDPYKVRVVFDGETRSRIVGMHKREEIKDGEEVVVLMREEYESLQQDSEVLHRIYEGERKLREAEGNTDETEQEPAYAC